MAGGLGERITWLLDRCWPFPLGILASTLALAMAAGIWLAVRSPQPPRAGRTSRQPGATETPAQVRTTLPSPAQIAAPAAPKPAAAPMPTSRPTPVVKASSTATAALAKPQVAKPKVQPRPVVPPLSAQQQAELTDRLTIGRFLMDRKEYSAAIKEFQAALAIDPASREAQAAIQQAREAGSD